MFRNDHDTYDRYSSYDSYGQEARIAGKQRYFAQTYGLMAGALAVTFLVALATARFFPQVAASSGIVIFLLQHFSVLPSRDSGALLPGYRSFLRGHGAVRSVQQA